MGTFAERLSEYQKKLGFKSVAAFAKAVNIPATTLHEVLKGRTKSLSAENTQKLADYMGISVDEVLGREKEKSPDAEAPRDIKNAKFNELLATLPVEEQQKVYDYLQFVADKYKHR